MPCAERAPDSSLRASDVRVRLSKEADLAGDCDQLPQREWRTATVYALVGAGLGGGVGLYFAIQAWTSDDPIVPPMLVIGAPMLFGALVGGVIGLAVEASRADAPLDGQ